MSTFDGRVKEFPDIRIDYFRPTQVENDTPPLAYLLSHVHSDHLTGLDSRHSCFIYCSPATRDILLRLEKYPHRMNFAKGILESRRQTYGHLKKLLKAIPLETPTTIELCPGKEVRVTLFDANHCVGAVGFLIEGDGKAIFYSGDVRSEAWWVEQLVRSPMMVSFTAKQGRRLDCVYLDTTFATKGEGGRYREFPSKAEGLRELVGKVGTYPEDTIFFYDAWTFGYEDVWQTLSTVLNTQIHVDDYRYGLYRSLANGIEPKAPEAAKMIGFWRGNHYQEGCLTDRWSRLHSCEYGTGCSVWGKDFVRITPIISRHNGMEMRELGAGGGKGDLNPKHELEFGDADFIYKMIETHEAKLKGQPDALSKMWKTISTVIQSGTEAIDLDVSALGLKGGTESQTEDSDVLQDLPLRELLPALAGWLQKTKANGAVDPESAVEQKPSAAPSSTALPKQITFPYSRHSSYTELCHLIAALKPRDIHPCTVDSANWEPEQSMMALFGHLYDEDDPLSFSHDQLMMSKMGMGVDLQPWRPYRQGKRKRSRSRSRSRSEEISENGGDGDGGMDEGAVFESARSEVETEKQTSTPAKSSRVQLTDGEAALAWRKEAHASALGARGRNWADVELVSVSGHQIRELEM